MKSTIRSMLAVVVGIAAVGLVAGACASQQQASGSDGQATTTEPPPQPGGRVVYGVAGEPDGWLPQASRFSPSAIQVAKVVFDPLVVLGADDKTHPYLAESLTPNADFTEWLIKARAGVSYHDGSPFDAQALKTNMDAFLASPLSSNALKPVTSVTVVDPLTIRVTMNQPWASFPTIFTTQVGYFASPKQVSATDTTTAVGTGPFFFDSWKRGQSLRVKKYDSYWQEGRPYLNEVEFQPIADGDSRRSALESGTVDIAHTNVANDLIRYRSGDVPPNTKVLVDEGEGDEYTVVMNTQTGVLADRNLRVALAQATDKQGLVDQLFQGYYQTADSPYGEASPWHTDVRSIQYDPEAARRAVDSWKQANGGKAPAFTYTIISTQDDRAVAQALQDEWQKAGFEVTISEQDETKFAATLVFGQYDAIALRYFNAPDPDGDYYFWSKDTVGPPGSLSLNFPRYANEATESGLQQGRRNVDPAVRKEGYAKVWQDWADNVPFLFVYHANWAIVYNDRVHGLTATKAPDGAALPPVVWGTTFLTNTWLER